MRSGFCNSPRPKLASHWLNRERSMVGSGGSSLAGGAGSSVARVPTGPAGSGSACWVIRHVRVRAEINAGDGPLRFKDDAANFGNSWCGISGLEFRPKLLLNRALAFIVRLLAGAGRGGRRCGGPTPDRVLAPQPGSPWGRGIQSGKLLRDVSGWDRAPAELSTLTFTRASGCGFAPDPHDSCVRPIRT